MRKLKLLLILACLGFSIFANAQKIDRAHWMAQLLKENPDVRLSQLSIPMAHDAATHAASLWWTKDQKYDEAELFSKGVRAFDMRVSCDDRGITYLVDQKVDDFEYDWNNYLFMDLDGDGKTERVGNLRHGGLGDDCLYDLNNFRDEVVYHLPSVSQIKDECMLLFFQYEGDDYTVSRDEFQKSIDQFLLLLMQKYGKNGKKPDYSIFADFKPDVKLKDIQNKIMIFTTEKKMFMYSNYRDSIPITLIDDTTLYDHSTADMKVEGNFGDTIPFCRVNHNDIDQGIDKLTIDAKLNYQKFWAAAGYDNPNNVFAWTALDNWAVGQGGAYYATDSWFKHIETSSNRYSYSYWGMNHRMFEYLSHNHKPLGITSFDFCDVDSYAWCDAYGNMLLPEIIRHNFINGRFIKDLALATSPTGNRTKSQDYLRNQGYTVIDYDLNNFTDGGDYEYLGIKYTNDPTEAIQDAIVIDTGKDGYKSPGDTITFNGRKFVRINGWDTDENRAFTGDLNHHTQGKGNYLWLYVTYEVDSLHDRPIQNLFVKTSSNYKGDDIDADVTREVVNMFWKSGDIWTFSGAADLNKGYSGSSDIFLYKDHHNHAYKFYGQFNDEGKHLVNCNDCGETTVYAHQTSTLENAYPANFAVDHQLVTEQEVDGRHVSSCTVDSCKFTARVTCFSNSYDSNGFGICEECGGNAYEEPDSVDGAYQIKNAGQLFWFRVFASSNANAKAVLTNDIVINKDMKQDNLREWIPCSFYGVLDGNGHTISGMYVNRSDGAGMFDLVDGATIKNLGIVNSKFIAQTELGTFAKYSLYSTFENVFSTADLVQSGVGTCCGGVYGSGYYTTVRNGYFNGSMKSDHWSAGCGYVGCETSNFYVPEELVPITTKGGTALPAADFASGKVCYLLNDSTYGKDAMWHQNIDASEIVAGGYQSDSAPVLSKSHSMVVPAQFNGKEFINLNVEYSDNSISYSRDTLDLKDGMDYSCPVDFTVKSASQPRTVSQKATWGTVCLPYKVYSRDNSVQFYRLTGGKVTDGGYGTLDFEPVDYLNAGEPGVFKKLDSEATSVTFFSEEYATVKAAEANKIFTSGAAKWETKGSYSNCIVKQLDGVTERNYYLDAEDGKFYTYDGTLNVRPFRGWFKILMRDYHNPNFYINIIDPTTGIDNTEVGTFDDCEINLPMYDLSGRRIIVPFRGQIVIHNNKKFLNKK